MSRRNENRLGYKHSKLGWIPNEWEVEHLSDLAEIQTGISKSSNRSLRQPVSLPYLRVANVQDGYLDLGELKQIEIEKADVERFLLQSGDVLFTEGGDFDKLGRGTIWKGEIEKCVHQNHIFAARVDKKKLLPFYLSTYASTWDGRRYFLLSSKQSTNLASINSTQLKQFPIPLPPISEQLKIAEILSTWDNAIEQMRKLIEAKKRRKKALMQQLFSEKKRSTVGKGAWKKYRLKDLLQEVSRPIDFHDEDFYDLISVRRRSEGIFYRGRVAGKDILTKLLYRTHSGDFLISKMQVVHGASALVTAQFDGLSISGSYIALRCKDLKKLNMNFFNWLSRTPRFYHLTYLSSYGVHIEKMTFNLKLFLKSEISIPEKVEEQERIADFFEAVGKEIGTLEKQLAALEKQKRGLMQKLLTGEVRVKV